MMQTTKKQITIQLEKMQVQKEAVDCGRFSIGYVMELCHMATVQQATGMWTSFWQLQATS